MDNWLLRFRKSNLLSSYFRYWTVILSEASQSVSLSFWKLYYPDKSSFAYSKYWSKSLGIGASFLSALYSLFRNMGRAGKSFTCSWYIFIKHSFIRTDRSFALFVSPCTMSGYLSTRLVGPSWFFVENTISLVNLLFCYMKWIALSHILPLDIIIILKFGFK